MEHLEQALTRLSDAGLKVNATKSSFCKNELEYLGYLINKEGVRPTMKKVEAIKNIATPKNQETIEGLHYYDK